MNKLNEELLNKIERKTKVKKEMIVSLAEKLSHGKMKDANTIKEVIDTLSKATGKPVSESVSDKIIKTIQDDKVPDGIEKMF